MKPILDPAQAKIERDAALVQVMANAPQSFKDEAMQAIVRAARAMPDFTTDDVWIRMTQKPPEPRAMGGVMQECRRLGYIVPTSTTRRSGQVSNHARPLTVWKSLIYWP